MVVQKGMRWQGFRPSGNQPLAPGAKSPKKRAKEGVKLKPKKKGMF